MQQAVKQFPIGATFGAPDIPPQAVITGMDQPNEFTPDRKPEYLFRKQYLRDMVGFFFSGDVALFMKGHKGCGKTTFVEQFHSALNLPLLTVNAHPRMEIADLIGHFIPNAAGGLEFHYGPVARAAKEGWSVLIDEYNLLDPGVSGGLNGLLQGGGVYIPETQEMLKPKEGFKVFAACNPADAALGYFGRNAQDAANEDRYWFIEMGYPTVEEETPLVERILLAGLDAVNAKTFADKMVDVANRIRNQFMANSDAGDAMELTMSTRSLLRWAKMMLLFSKVDSPLHYALERALTNRATKETKVAIHEVVHQVFGEPYTL
jgi:cobaltochelatase CobS